MNKMDTIFIVRQTSGQKFTRSESVVKLFFVIKRGYVFSKVNMTERAFKLCRFPREKMAPKKIVAIVTHDSKTIIFIDQDIYVNHNIMYNMDTKEIIERIIMAANSLNIVSDGSKTKSIGKIIHISNQEGELDLMTSMTLETILLPSESTMPS